MDRLVVKAQKFQEISSPDAAAVLIYSLPIQNFLSSFSPTLSFSSFFALLSLLSRVDSRLSVLLPLLEACFFFSSLYTLFLTDIRFADHPL